MAQLMARGFSAYDSHRHAGYSPNTGNSSVMSNLPEMKERIAELKEQYTHEKDLKKELSTTDASDIDEDWYVDKLRTVTDAALAMEKFKEAFMCLEEIARVKTIGDHNVKANNTKGMDAPDRQKSLPAPPAINIHVLADQ